MLRYVLFIIGVAAIAACSNAPATIYIEGQVEDVAGEEVMLHRSDDRYAYREWTHALDTTTADSTGAFAFTYATNDKDYYQVVGLKGFPLFADIYLEPGDSLTVTKLPEAEDRRFAFAGARAGAYDYYVALDSLARADTVFGLRSYELARMEIDSMKNAIGHKRDRKMAIVDRHFAGHPEWAPLELRLRDEITYSWADEHYRYLYYHNYYTRDTFVYFLPDSGYYDFLDEIDLDSCPDYYSYEYLTFLSSFLRDRVFVDYDDLSDTVIYDNMLPFHVETAKKYLSGTPLDMAFLALTSDFSQYLSMDDFFEQMDAMEVYLAANHTSPSAYERFRFVQSEYEYLRPGNPAPELALPDVNGDTVRLSDMAGKVVYMDFWGTWCYPCLQELPNSLALQEKFADEPVEFVYIGLESTDQIPEWREFILGERSLSYAPFLEQRVYPGIHLLSEGQFGNPAIQPYRIGAAPTYVLIDAHGRIVRANAPRPGDEETEELIREALAGLD